MQTYLGRRQFSRRQRQQPAGRQSAQQRSKENVRIVDVDVQLIRVAADAQIGRPRYVRDPNVEVSNDLASRNGAGYEALGAVLEPLIAPGLCLSEVVMRSVPLSFQVARSLSDPVVLGTSTVMSMNE
jgi:hypothetical protein